MEMQHLIASACWCTLGPLEFERGHCARCGHWIDVVIEADGLIANPYVALGAVIEEYRLKLLDEAEEDGVDVDDRDAYRGWLEAKMESLDREREADLAGRPHALIG